MYGENRCGNAENLQFSFNNNTTTTLLTDAITLYIRRNLTAATNKITNITFEVMFKVTLHGMYLHSYCLHLLHTVCVQNFLL